MTVTSAEVSDEELIAVLEANGGSIRAAARITGLARSTAMDRTRRLVTRGYSPKHDMTKVVPEPYIVKGHSSLYGPEGELKLQWVKTTIDHQKLELMIREMCLAAASGLPQIKPTRAKGVYLSHLMAVYPIGDAHIGMRAWDEECGQNWDLKIAEQTQCSAMAALVDGAPASETATIVNLGDWFHYDNIEGVTSRSGNVLDVDGRYAKMVWVGMQVMIQSIDSALKKHKTVRVINLIGNHDDTGAIWLSTALNHMYAKEKRVTVDTTPASFNYFRHGKVLVGCHHGHSCKMEKLPAVMAADRPKDWGETEYRYWYMGHVHHQNVKEFPGVTCESFNTLAAADAYAVNHGYRSQQNMKCIVLHDLYGEVARHTINTKML